MVPELIAHFVAPLVAVVGELLSIFDAVRSIACQLAGGRPIPRHGPFSCCRSIGDARSGRRGPLTRGRLVLQELGSSAPSAGARTGAGLRRATGLL